MYDRKESSGKVSSSSVVRQAREGAITDLFLPRAAYMEKAYNSILMAIFMMECKSMAIGVAKEFVDT